MKKTASLLFVILLLLAMQGCKGKYFNMPGPSMEGTIKTGSRFYVVRAKEFKRNDLVVFDYYGNDYSSIPDEYGKQEQHWEKRLFRLIGLSGDSLLISKGDVFINGKPIPLPEKAVFEYEIVSNTLMTNFPKRINEDEQMYTQEGNIFRYRLPLTKNEAEGYSERPEIIGIKKIIVEPSMDNPYIINPCETCNWSPDYFGPLAIPSPGDTVLVDEHNLNLYKNIPGIRQGKNVVKEKLYFVMGDNRHNAEDSRFIGFISHGEMYGVVK